MIHVRFIEKPRTFNKYQKQYDVINMIKPENNINFFQIFSTTSKKKILSTNLSRLGQIGLLLTNKIHAKESEKKDFLKKFKLVVLGFYEKTGFVDNNYNLKFHNYKDADFPTLPVFVSYLEQQFKKNVNHPTMLSFLENLQLTFERITKEYDGAVSNITHLDNVLNSKVKNKEKRLIIDLTPFYQRDDKATLYSLVVSIISLFKEYGKKHPLVQFQLDIEDLMNTTNNKPKKSKPKVHKIEHHKPHNSSIQKSYARQPHITYTFNRKTHRGQVYFGDSGNLNQRPQQQQTNQNTQPSEHKPQQEQNNHNNQATKQTVSYNNQNRYNYNNQSKESNTMSKASLIKDIFFADLIQHKFDKANDALAQLKRDMNPNDYKLLANDIANQKSTVRKFGDDLTTVAEHMYD